MKANRSLVLSCVRIIAFCFIFCQFFTMSGDHWRYFTQDVHPTARSGLYFAIPMASTGEAYILDFTTFYAAGLLNKQRIEKNLSIDIYDPFLFTQAIERVAAPIKAQGTFCLQYPPIFFALVTPLAYFNAYTAWRIWIFASALFLTIAYLFTAYDLLKNRPLLLCGLFITLTNFPAADLLCLGQMSGIELAFIALSFRLLIDKKYFSAGLVAAGALLKLHQSLIILLPGFCTGKKDFLRGFLLMTVMQFLLSVPVVGYYNITNFIRTNYMSEIAHTYGDMNDVWWYQTFRGMLKCLPWFISSADAIGWATYLLVIAFAVILWLKVFPLLQKKSGCAIQLLGSVSMIALIVFSPHGYWYDQILYMLPCLWLYIWSTTDEFKYTLAQSIIRLIISITVLYVPLFQWENVLRRVVFDTTIMWDQIRLFSMGLVLLGCAITAVVLEFKTQREPIVSLIE